MTKGMESVCVVESVAKVVVIEVPANLATGHFRSDAEQVFRFFQFHSSSITVTAIYSFLFSTYTRKYV